MQILYTGATKSGAEQLDPSLSLGGLISSSAVPNGSLSNVFSQASNISIQGKKRECKLLAIYNNDGDILTDISLNFTLENNSICKYKVAFVTPAASASGPCFEQIANTNALPYYATFQNIVSGESILIPTISSGDYLGIWLVREYDFSATELKTKVCSDWLAELEAGSSEVDTEESLVMEINYTIGEPSVSSSNSSSVSTSVIL